MLTSWLDPQAVRWKTLPHVIGAATEACFNWRRVREILSLSAEPEHSEGELTMHTLFRLGLFVVLLAPFAILPDSAKAQEEEVIEVQEVEVVIVEPEEKSFGHKLLFYIPNRVFDVFDIVRARVRVGPGVAVDARVTKYGDVFAGGYSTIWVGLPGPRTEPKLPLPIGVEARAGIGVTDLVDVATEGPAYGYGEVGVGFQALIVGVDVGVDPIEAVDLLLGFLFIDVTGDDY
jgi:hypothetical protein